MAAIIALLTTLVAQLDKLAKHNRQGSYQTRHRYYEAMKRFCRFLAEAFHGLRLMLDRTERGHKLFVPDGIPTDRAINNIQLFIIRHRDATAEEVRHRQDAERGSRKAS